MSSSWASARSAGMTLADRLVRRILRLDVHDHVLDRGNLGAQAVLHVVGDGVRLGGAHLGRDLDVQIHIDRILVPPAANVVTGAHVAHAEDDALDLADRHDGAVKQHLGAFANDVDADL